MHPAASRCQKPIHAACMCSIHNIYIINIASRHRILYSEGFAIYAGYDPCIQGDQIGKQKQYIILNGGGGTACIVNNNSYSTQKNLF